MKHPIPTPRTDAVKASLEEVVRRFTNAAMPTQVIVSGMELVTVDFARDLERDLFRMWETAHYYERRTQAYRERFGFQADIENPSLDHDPISS